VTGPARSLAVRRAVRADAAAIAMLERECFPHPWTELQVLGELTQPAPFCWVASAAAGDGATLVGYALFRRVLDEAELLRLAVAPSRRRLGLAAALVEGGLAELRASDCAVAFLEVREDNAGAIGFYEANGWHRAGRRTRYYPDGADALLYRRSLRADPDRD
jgi:[ribosomal protein S18]-alanine N-acetyltransferase